MYFSDRQQLFLSISQQLFLLIRSLSSHLSKAPFASQSSRQAFFGKSYFTPLLKTLAQGLFASKIVPQRSRKQGYRPNACSVLVAWTLDVLQPPSPLCMHTRSVKHVDLVAMKQCYTIPYSGRTSQYTMKQANKVKAASTMQTLHNRTSQEKYQEFKVSEHLYHHLANKNIHKYHTVSYTILINQFP